MDIAAGVFFGLIAMLGWASADFFAKKLVDRIGGFNALFFEQIVAIVFLAPIVWLVAGDIGLTWDVLPLLLVTTAFWTYPYLSFYKGFEKGMLSVIAPIGAAWGGGAAVLAAFLLNESLTLPQWSSVAAILIGLFLVSTSWKDLKKLSYKKLAGVEWAVIALLGWSASAVLMKPLVLEVGPFISILLIKIVAMPMMLLALPFTNYKIKTPIKFWKLVVLIGIIDAIAFLGYNFGVEVGQVGIVGPIAAAFPVVTVILAWLFLKERLEKSQVLGVGLSIVGMIALATL